MDSILYGMDSILKVVTIDILPHLPVAVEQVVRPQHKSLTIEFNEDTRNRPFTLEYRRRVAIAIPVSVLSRKDNKFDEGDVAALALKVVDLSSGNRIYGHLAQGAVQLLSYEDARRVDSWAKAWSGSDPFGIGDPLPRKPHHDKYLLFAYVYVLGKMPADSSQVIPEREELAYKYDVLTS